MKSFSKIRHIQESNLRLEKRYLIEQTTGDTISPKGISSDINKTVPPEMNIEFQNPNDKIKKPIVNFKLDKSYFERNPKGTVKFAERFPNKPIEINGFVIPKQYDYGVLEFNKYPSDGFGRGFYGGAFNYVLKYGKTMGNPKGERYLGFTGVPPESGFAAIYIDREPQN